METVYRNKGRISLIAMDIGGGCVDISIDRRYLILVDSGRVFSVDPAIDRETPMIPVFSITDITMERFGRNYYVTVGYGINDKHDAAFYLRLKELRAMIKWLRSGSVKDYVLLLH